MSSKWRPRGDPNNPNKAKLIDSDAGVVRKPRKKVPNKGKGAGASHHLPTQEWKQRDRTNWVGSVRDLFKKGDK